MQGCLDNLSQCLYGTWAACFQYKNRIPPIKSQYLLDSVEKLATKLQHGEVSCVDILEIFIARITEINPPLNCVVDTDYDNARLRAEYYDSLTKMHGPYYLRDTYPLFGVPFTVKETFAVEGLSNTAGLKRREGTKATGNAEVVQKLVDLGAIPVAVSNCSELAMWVESKNPIYGTTRNPHDSRHSAGGSSGGEAAIVSVAASAFGIGSDIGGSLRIPAALCGVYAHKPSPGLVSNDGVLPDIPESLNGLLSAGPLCRKASDLRFVCKALFPADGPKLNEDVKMDEVVFYYMKDDGGGSRASRPCSAVRLAFYDLIGKLKKSGKQVKELNLELMKNAAEMWSAICFGAGSPSFSESLAAAEGEALNGWTELVKWVFCRSDHTFPAIALSLAERLHRQQDVFGENKRKAESWRDKLRRDFEQALGDKNVFLYPTQPRMAPYHNQSIFMPYNFAYTAVFNVLGFPVTQCPLFTTSDLPVGVQVVATAGNDNLTLAVARYFEDNAYCLWTQPCSVDSVAQGEMEEPRGLQVVEPVGLLHESSEDDSDAGIYD